MNRCPWTASLRKAADRGARLLHAIHDHQEPWFDDDDPCERDRCARCGGEGFVEYNDAPETWGEDCPSEVNHLVTCPDCCGLVGGRARP